jgi:hypothetical protein
MIQVKQNHLYFSQMFLLPQLPISGKYYKIVKMDSAHYTADFGLWNAD